MTRCDTGPVLNVGDGSSASVDIDTYVRQAAGGLVGAPSLTPLKSAVASYAMATRPGSPATISGNTVLPSGAGATRTFLLHCVPGAPPRVGSLALAVIAEVAM